jgi:hypothetical protein
MTGHALASKQETVPDAAFGRCLYGPAGVRLAHTGRERARSHVSEDLGRSERGGVARHHEESEGARPRDSDSVDAWQDA